MKHRNPIRRERLLDLSSNTPAVRPGRLDLSIGSNESIHYRRRRLAEASRHEADDPESWVNRHLQPRLQALHDRGESAPNILLSIER